MQKIVILKLDTPCTLVESAMRVPTAEPVNFAKALVEAHPDETVDVCLLGHAAKQIEVGDNGTIRTIPYFGDPRSIRDEFDDDTKVILWQGRHLLTVQMPTTPTQLGAQPTLMNPWCAGDYERLCMVKIWQVQMYNLMSSNVISDKCKKYFIVTDLRLPLIELNKIDSVSVPKPLPKDIILLTQAYHHEEYNKWQAKYGNCMTYPEMNLADYTYEFKRSEYLPLHVLPLWSHEQFAMEQNMKRRVSIFQVQSMKYIDDYRKKKLGEALKFVDGNCTLHGRFRSDERGIVVAAYPKYADKLLANCIDNSDNPSECFFDSARILADHQASLIITDERYARFGLCPNRFIEALAVGTIPLSVAGVFDYCDDLLKQAVESFGIDASKTRINEDGRVELYDKDYKAIDMSAFETTRKSVIKAFKDDLLTKLNTVFNKF